VDVAARHNVRVLGPEGAQPMVLAHGFGCDQNMWRFVAPHFADRYRVVLFDHIGAGGSDLTAYDVERHASLDGYADDVLELIGGLGLEDVIFVGHSVSATIGMLAAAREPELFAHLVLVGPSPRYIDDGEYVGGFSEADIHGLLASLESNYLGWSQAMAPVIMGRPDEPALGQELTASFCRTDPDIAARFARATFLSDNRADLERVRTPALVLQCADDAIAPVSVGRYVAAQLPDARFVMLDAVGHCPNLSSPEETSDAIDRYLRDMAVAGRT
jgi:sigma-B regulation protein RsbQ